MKTIADFKRRIVVGARLRVTNYIVGPAGKLAPVTERVVSRVQSKQFATKFGDREIWCNFPKVADFRVDGPDTVTFLDTSLRGSGEGVPYVTFEFLKEKVCGVVCRTDSSCVCELPEGHAGHHKSGKWGYGPY